MAVIITNRRLSTVGFLERIEELAQKKPRLLILREKDLTYDEYTLLALRVKEITEKYGSVLVVNYFVDAAKKTGIKKIHLPISIFEEKKKELKGFELKGASVHSVNEAQRAERAGADYIIAGHIFETQCKNDLKPRGLDFLRQVCQSVNIPVYAVGGINNSNQGLALNAGAADVCVMSGAMTGKFNF